MIKIGIYYKDIELSNSYGGVNEGGNEDVYSTDEVRIGTWIDGKPLYRKITTGIVLPQTISTASTRYPSGIKDEIDTMVTCFANVLYGPDNDQNWISSNYQSSGGIFICGIYINSRDLFINNTLQGAKGKTCFAITEYTKQKD